MKLLLFLLLLAALSLWPFVLLRRPWAVRLWQRVRLFLIVYVFVLVVATAMALIFRWDDIYG